MVACTVYANTEVRMDDTTKDNGTRVRLTFDLTPTFLRDSVSLVSLGDNGITLADAHHLIGGVCGNYQALYNANKILFQEAVALAFAWANFSKGSCKAASIHIRPLPTIASCPAWLLR